MTVGKLNFPIVHPKLIVETTDAHGSTKRGDGLGWLKS
jgi:hypothetical protein